MRDFSQYSYSDSLFSTLIVVFVFSLPYLKLCIIILDNTFLYSFGWVWKLQRNYVLHEEVGRLEAPPTA